MKIILPKSLQNFKKYFKKHVGQEGPRPDHDWQILLSLTGVVILVGACVCGYLLYRINEGDIFTVPAVASKNDVKINTKLLESTVGQFEQLKIDTRSLQGGRALTPDPSL
jgi:hypothetical protein